MKKQYLISFFLLFAVFTQAQTDFKKIVPPNPNVASLFKSVITPVTEYSGLPNVAIPLYTASEGAISVPISLSYATGGIQVSEESGVVGLGWALNAGGAITRSVVGEDDFDLTYGYLAHNVPTPDIPFYDPAQNSVWNPDTGAFVNTLSPTSQEDCDFLANNNPYTYELPPLPGGLDYDFQPDMFHFNFGEYSGSFVMTRDREILLTNKKGIKIIFIAGGTNGIADPSFEIVSEDGTIYEFYEKARTTYPNGQSTKEYITTWFLKKITDIYGNIAEFNYNMNEKIEPFRSFTQSYIANVGNGANGTVDYEEYPGPSAKIDNPYLTSIITKKANGAQTQEVVFNYSQIEDRLDIDARYLQSIEVINQESEVVNIYEFTYCYFGNNLNYSYENISLANGDFGQTIGALSPQYPDLNLRLRLDQVTENNIGIHSFEYFDNNNIPNKTSFSQDYWGFYNGEFNSESFIPEINSFNEEVSSFDQLKRANRLPNEDNCKLFSLKKIYYPTGGATEFDYELNTFTASDDLTYEPTPTVLVRRPISALSTFEPNTQTEIIKPNQASTLKISYNVTFTGWNTELYPDNQSTNPPKPDFTNDFYVALRRKSDNQIVHKFNIDSNNQEWDNIMQNRGNPDFTYEDKIIQYTDSQEWSYDFNEPTFRLTEDEYILEAFFDSSQGLYYGQSNITAEWEDIEVDNENQYSVGGGLRVKSILDYENSGNLATKRNYNYHYNEVDENQMVIKKSYGKIKTLPDYAINRLSAFDARSRSDSFGNDQGPTGYLPTIIGSASSQNSFSKDAGSYVGYDRVEIFSEGDDGDNGKTVKYFHNPEDLYRAFSPVEYVDDYYKNPPIRLPHNGLLEKEENYKRDGSTYILITKKENFYTVNGVESNQFTLSELYENTDRIISATKELPITYYGVKGQTNRKCDFMKFQLYPHYSNLIQQTGTTQTIYDTNGNNGVTTVQEFKYENPTHFQRTESKLTNSKGEEVITKTYYADDIAETNTLNGPAFTSNEMALINLFKRDDQNSLHRIAEPIQTETTINGEKTIVRNSYKDWDTNPNDNLYKVWPQFAKTLKGQYNETTNPLEVRLNYHAYDDVGNPIEVSKEKGTKIAYLWGYDLKYPIAKIDNATHASSLSAALSALPNGYTDLETFLSYLDDIQNDTGKKAAWKAFNKDFRSALSDQMITTYTYDPLVGVTSVTDPRGYTMYYQYDAQNRLIEVRDADDHLVTDYEYHYKGQSN